MRKISKQIKRCMAMVLTVAMLASLVTVTASAEEQKSVTLYDVVAENLTDAEGAILTSGALKGNSASIQVNVPTDADDLVDVDADLKLTADTFASGQGADWTPDSYVATNVNGIAGSEQTYSAGAVLPVDSKKVGVNYELDLTDKFGSTKVLDAMNLPYQLVTMENAMKRLYNNADSLAEMDKTVIQVLRSLTRDPIAFTVLPEYQTLDTKLAALMGCIDGSTNRLALHGLLVNSYAGNIEYYWANHPEFLAELDEVYAVMKDLVALETSATDNGLTDLVNANQAALESYGYYEKALEYLPKFTSIVDKIEDVHGDLHGTVQYIDKVDQASGNLPALIAAVEADAANSAAEYATPKAVMHTTLEETIVRAFNLKVNLKIGALREESFTYGPYDYADVPNLAAVKDEISAWAEGELGTNAAHYSNDYNEAVLDALSTGMTGDEEFTFTWTPKTYAVKVEGAFLEDITIEDATVTLPKADADGEEITYAFGGVDIATSTYTTSGTYTFTPAQLSNDMNITVSNIKAVRYVTINLAIGSFNEQIKVPYDYNTVPDVAALKAQVSAKLEGNDAHYTTDYTGAELDALAGVGLTENKEFSYTWTPKTYKVKLDGVDTWDVTIENKTVTLPKTNEDGMEYIYSFGGAEIARTDHTADRQYTFDASDLSDSMNVTRAIQAIRRVTVTLNIGSTTETIEQIYNYGSIPDIADLKSQITAKLGGNAAHYTTNYAEAELDALIGVGLTEHKAFTYTWTPKNYTVKLDGANYDTVNIDDRVVTLPKATEENMEIVYSFGGAEIATSTYTVAGTYTFAIGELTEPLEIVVSDIKAVRTVTVNMNIGSKPAVSVYVSCDYGEYPDIADLKAQITAKLAGNDAHYETAYTGAELDALAGVGLTENKVFTYTWTPKAYTVKLNGVDHETVTIEDLKVVLPKASEAGKENHYSFGGVEIGSTNHIADKEHTFAISDLSDSMNITYTVKDIYAVHLEDYVDEVNAAAGYEAFKLEKDSGGAYTGITANISGDALLDIVQKMAKNSVYSYIGLNNKELCFGTVTVQTLLDAMLADPNFNRDAVIGLGDGSGCLLTATLQLGTAKNVLEYQNLEFKMNLINAPSQITGISNMLNREKIKSHLDFKTENGDLAIELSLPEKIYEIYLAALTMTDNVDLTDVNAVNNLMVHQFIEDYVDVLVGGEVTYTTYAKTAQQLGYNLDAYMGAYKDYIDVLLEMDFLVDDNDNVLVYEESVGKYLLGMAIEPADLRTLINDFAQTAGKDPRPIIALVTECDPTLSTGLFIPMTLNITNLDTASQYDAIVITTGPLSGGMKDKLNAINCTNTLGADLNAISDGYTVVVLQDDVTDNLTFKGTAILDLNGNNVSGDITANGKLFIIDRTMATATTGTVSGNVTGNVYVLAGNYTNANVSSFLKEGYYQDGSAIRNYVYSIEEAPATFARRSAAGINFVVDMDKMIEWADYNYKALAVDMISDLILNYYYSAAMTFTHEGNTYNAYSVDSLDDLFGLYADYTDGGLDDATIDELLKSFTLAGDTKIQGFVNALLADLLDFKAVATAVAAGDPVTSFAVSTKPWKLNLQHDTANNVFVAGIIPDPDTAKVATTNVGVMITGTDAAALFTELGKINDGTTATVTLNDLAYASKTVTASGSAKVNVSLDMTGNTNYAVVVAGILANANVSNKADFVAALNAFNGSDTTAIRTAFDEVTVAELITSMKALDPTVDFATICTNLGVTLNTANAATLEDVYHAVLCTIGKLAKAKNITGSAVKMGTLCTTANGVYTYSADKANLNYSGSKSVRGYGVSYSATLEEIKLTLDLFKATSRTPSSSGSGGALDTKNHFSYMVGYADGTLNPYGKMTRGQAATIFFRLLTDEAREQYWSQTNRYSDCDATLWCNNAISTLSNMGIIDGYTDGTFRPNAYVTRAQFAKMAVGFFETTTKAYQGYFTDVDAVSVLSSYVEAAADAGLVQGYGDGTFRPNDYITRAQACVIINRALGRVPHKDYLLDKNEMLTWSDCSTSDWFYADVMEATNSHDYAWKYVDGKKVEIWTKKLDQRDWTALEHSWSTAHSAPGGEV